MHKLWKKTHKYNAKKVKINGVSFDSKKEAKRYFELKILERAGVISNLILQPKFLLQDGFERDGKKYRAIFYIADFEYIQDGKRIVEDVKGVKTDIYKLKKKMFLKKYPQVVFKEI
jgi:hypothetical protein